MQANSKELYTVLMGMDYIVGTIDLATMKILNYIISILYIH